jgi:hypothetical protein
VTYPAEWGLMDTFMLGLFVGFLLASWWERYRERRQKPSGNLTGVTDTGCQPEKSWNA